VIELLALPVGVSRSAVASAIPIAIIAVAAGVICRIVPRIGDLGCLACVDPDVRALVVWGEGVRCCGIVVAAICHICLITYRQRHCLPVA